MPDEANPGEVPLPHKTATDRFASRLAPRPAGVLAWLGGWEGGRGQLQVHQQPSGAKCAMWVDFTN